MTDEENPPRKGKLRRAILDVLGVIGGLVALFQFVISDNVSSQWFRPARNWIAGVTDLSEEMRAFSGWWSEFTAPFVPGRVQFDEWPIFSHIALLVIAILFLFLLGTLFVNFVDTVARFREICDWQLMAALLFCVAVSVYTLWVFSAAAAPLLVWVLLVVALFGGIGFFVWLNVPPPKQEPRPAPKKKSRPEQHSLLAEQKRGNYEPPQAWEIFPSPRRRDNYAPPSDL